MKDWMKERMEFSEQFQENDNLLIDTPWGKKRWGMLREAMELYNKHQNEGESHERVSYITTSS
jgi:hypothetical protein